jgi:hypothetical protein
LNCAASLGNITIPGKRMWRADDDAAIALELKTWGFAQRCFVYLMLLLLTLAICPKTFVCA